MSLPAREFISCVGEVVGPLLALGIHSMIIQPHTRSYIVTWYLLNTPDPVSIQWAGQKSVAQLCLKLSNSSIYL